MQDHASIEASRRIDSKFWIDGLIIEGACEDYLVTWFSSSFEVTICCEYEATVFVSEFLTLAERWGWRLWRRFRFWKHPCFVYVRWHHQCHTLLQNITLRWEPFPHPQTVNYFASPPHLWAFLHFLAARVNIPTMEDKDDKSECCQSFPLSPLTNVERFL